MLAQEYWDLKKKHEQEITDFPIAWAFSDEQLVSCFYIWKE